MNTVPGEPSFLPLAFAMTGSDRIQVDPPPPPRCGGVRLHPAGAHGELMNDDAIVNRNRIG